MKQIRLINWLLKIDAERTKEFYCREIAQCDCLYCENYREAYKYAESSVMEIFAALGINPLKPSHLSEFGEIEDGLHLYHGSYHAVGKLIEGEYCTDSEWYAANTAEIGNFTFGFARDLMCVHDAFPRPILQLEVEARIP